MEEYETMSDSEKASSIRSKIKNIQYQKYSLELDLVAENAIAEPDAAIISSIQLQMSNLDAKQAALSNELSLLNVV
jgi:hypothetical protein